MSLMDDHTHCLTCIRIKCTSYSGCPIVNCGQDCGAIFHWCKTEDHKVFCPNVRVPCVNQLYGCPIELVRRDMNAHIAVCPASVVSCTFEWNRWPVYAKERNKLVPGKRAYAHARNGQLDVALTLRDQNMLKDAMKVPIGLRKTLKNKLSPRFPAVPLVPSHGGASLDDLAAETERIYLDASVQNGKNVLKPHENQNSENSPTIPEPPPLPPSQTLSLDLTVESVTKYQSKPDSMYTFQCQQAFQRCEYPWHVKNIHSEIFMNLNGWMQNRCPLSFCGCDHLAVRLSPNGKGWKVVYNTVLETFGIQPHVPQEHLRINPSTDIALTDLPMEVLEVIAENLDGFSLNNLALTCQIFQNVCYNILERKGIVVLQWQKNAEGVIPKWHIADKLWMFSNAVVPVHTWVSNDLFSMTDHLAACPFNKKRDPPESDRVLVMVTGDNDESLYTCEYTKVNDDTRPVNDEVRQQGCDEKCDTAEDMEDLKQNILEEGYW